MKNNQKKPQNKVTKDMKIKSLIVASLFFIACGFIVYNMMDLQIIRYEEFKTKASAIQLRDTKISPKRGTIYDANMKVLAQSATVWTINVSPAESDVTQHERIAQRLSEILEVEKEGILKKLEKTTSRYEVIKYKIDKPQADEVRKFCMDEDIDGVNLVEDFKRYYPYGDFAATILGFCGNDNQGLAGIESYYDEELTGVYGRVISAKNGWGLDMGYEYEELNKAQDGASLITTIDETVQHYLEKYLSVAANEFNVENRAVGIVMNVKTGAILAMSTKPDFDPNEPFTIQDQALLDQINALTTDEEKNDATSKARQAQWRNKAVSDLYEPGSVFKIITASGALDSATSSLSNTFHCTGVYHIGGWPIRCNNTSGHGTLNFTQAFINSCNPAFIEMGQKMGIETFNDYFASYGMSEKTGIDLPGEQLSIFAKPESMSTTNLASYSFGQTFKITPVQMITAVATAVNGGQLVVPHIASKLVDKNGDTIKTLTPQPKRQVISEDVSKKIAMMMQENVDTGNGKHAYVIGYKVGGKSGTSQKLDTPEDDTDYIASFVGVAPCDDPEIAVLIFFDTPRTDTYYGGPLAGPIVGAMMGDVLPYLGIEPTYSEAESAKVAIPVKKVTDITVAEAQSQLQRAGFLVKAVGSGDKVISQFPLAGVQIMKGSVVILYTDTNAQTVMATMPSLIGKTPSEVFAAMTAIGLNIKEEGASSTNSTVKVSKQSINPGDKIPLGTVVTITWAGAEILD